MLKNAANMHVAVIGLGPWGMALALHALRRGFKVTGWHHNQNGVAEMLSTRSFQRGSISAQIPGNLTITSDLASLSPADLTIVALPASAWAEVVPNVRASVLVSATKGVEPTTSLTPLRYAARDLSYSSDTLAVISGPSFASDLIAERPISIVAASTSEKTAAFVAEALSGNSLRVYTSTDPIGVELGGILKNIIAIAVGVSDALGYGPSARAALISRGLAEMARFATALGAQERTLGGLSGLGDLVMTATENQSRNRTVGLRLGKGEKIADITASLGSVAEGVTAAPLALGIAKSLGVEVPITEHITMLLTGQLAPADLAAALMARPIRSEF